MATPITNTYTTKTAVGVRESLSDRMRYLDPMETPFYMMCRKTKAEARRHDYLAWEKNLGTASNKSEGEDVTAADISAVSKPTRFDNACSIHWQAYIISGSLTAVDVAARKDELTWQVDSHAMDVRRHANRALLANAVKSYTEPQATAGLPTFADGGDGTAADATVAKTTPEGIETAAEKIANNGHTPTVCLLLPTDKKNFSAAAIPGQATSPTAKQLEVSITPEPELTLAGAVSIYLTDQGLVQMVVDRYMAAGRGYLLDHREFAVAELRSFDQETLGSTGDAVKQQIIWEGTLEANNAAVSTLQ